MKVLINNKCPSSDTSYCHCLHRRKLPQVRGQIQKFRLEILINQWWSRQIRGTSWDFQAAEEIVSLGHTARVADHVDVVALELVEDVDGGHAAVEILSIIVELEVIDGHEVVVLTVGESPLQGDGLRSVGATVSVVSGW